MLKIKRIYEKPDTNDGLRVLVDRLWPRGMSKEEAKIDKWLKDIAPSNDLRKWFAHKQERWDEFKSRYAMELRNKKDLLAEIKIPSKNKTITLLYAAKDKRRNNAQAILEFIKKQ